MNERIRELADQMFGMEEFEYAEEFLNDAFMEKFAQLIVRECCDWIAGSPATDAGQLLLTKSFITANLKAHFGVRE